MVKKQKETKGTKSIVSHRKGQFVFFGIFLIFIYLFGQILYINFAMKVDGKTIKEKALLQSTQSKLITAKRGDIYDRLGKTLAMSVDVDTISVNPKYLKVENKTTKTIDEVETKNKLEKIANAFVEIFELKKEDVLAKLESNREIETIVSKVEKEKVDKFEEWRKKEGYFQGINIDPDIKRYYPYNNLASNVIGFCGQDNQGLEGLENSYDNVLRGKAGRIVTAVGVSRSLIPDSNLNYIESENGSNIYLTLDSNIQMIAEKYLKQAVDESKSEKGGNVIIMDPKTGDVLAMATYPNYNLNTPMTITEEYSKGYDKLSAEEKTERLYQMWRNKAVVDTYEPGSTFKTLTAAIGIEENLAKTDTSKDFWCQGYEQIYDAKIRCTSSGHGYQTLREALQNSCNPAMMQLGKRIGVDTFYKYLKAYGLFDDTGIDLPSEGKSTFWNQKDVGPVELATMSFGQRFRVTPIQMITAISSLANDGMLVQPRLVGKIENSENGEIKTQETKNLRQVVSTETAKKLKDMMKSVVTSGGGKYAQVRGYEIGGKTGTSEPDPSSPEDGYVSSFVAIAPVENTKVSVLLTLYKPKVKNYYGSQIAAPVVSQMLTEILPYLNIESTVENQNESNITVPNLKGKTVLEAGKQLEQLGLKYELKGSKDDKIVMQTPISGNKLINGGIVKIYTSENIAKDQVEVPDLKGLTKDRAKVVLNSKKLNVEFEGRTNGVVIAQEIAIGTKVDEGSIIKLKLQDQVSQTER